MAEHPPEGPGKRQPRDRRLAALEKQLDRYLEDARSRHALAGKETPAHERGLTSQQLEDIIAHLAAQRRAKRAAILTNLLDLADRAGTTVGALSLIALFFADKHSHATLVVANTAKPLWGACIGFGLALVASYAKALLTWRDK
ncbi:MULTISPECIES: hypothetical protein [Halomonas]|uniref:hypothetical protein n=1 Tax=Halomonas TaxID=2745 RepID=UPI001C98C572|nr:MULTISPECIES: hypothetical protein [Halomonas]MBY5969711.1 hypothetical protein [Halomonas denitrificans]MBY6029712.1 hypothetical protein [Halomonas sp. DP8Y7-1]